MELKRRTFLELGGAGVLAPVVPPKKFSATDTVELGKTGIKTSRLCFGTGVKSHNRNSGIGRTGHENAVKLIRHAYECGVRCFDMADSYGTHGFVAEALAPFPRESYTLVSKIWFRGGGIPAEDKKPAAETIERFLRELKTDYVDVVQLHCVTSGKWPQENVALMEGLEAAKKAGKIRAHGLSMHNIAALKTAAETPWAEVCHVRINPFKVLMDGPVEEISELCRKLHGRGAGVIGIKILGEGWVGQYPEKIDESLAFAVKGGFVDILDIGFLTVAEFDDIVARIARI